jgi:hypothetical protein
MIRGVRFAAVALVVATGGAVLASPASAEGELAADVLVLSHSMREFSCAQAPGSTECKELVSAGEPLDFVVQVLDSEGGPPATGDVSIVEGDTSLATATIDDQGLAFPSVANGLSAGTHNLVIAYWGDDNHRSEFAGETFIVEVIPAPGARSFQRIAGANRMATAANLSSDLYRSADHPHGVFIARADDPFDALCAGGVAGWTHRSVLLTDRDALSPETRAELQRTPRPTEVFVVGGTSAVSDRVIEEIRALGLTVNRLAGNNRFETCIAVIPPGTEAEPRGEWPTFYVTGLNPYDALAASAAASSQHGVILLTNGESMHDATRAYVEQEGAGGFAIGGAATRAAPEAFPIAGNDRYETAAKVADEFFEDAPFVGVATGTGWADALAGGPHIWMRGRGPLLLVSDRVPQPVADFLASRQSSTVAAFVYGGTVAVSDQVAADIASKL